MEDDNPKSPGTQPALSITRPALDLPKKREYCEYIPLDEPGTIVRLRRYVKKQTTCSTTRVRRLVERRIPILEWLPKYDIKKNILGDTIAGITVAILHIPQGMGFALLANIPAVCGIYMAFFPVLSYAILASSRHNSVGTYAVITMMVGKVVKQYATFPDDSTGLYQATNTSLTGNGTQPDGGPVYTPIEVATIVCFVVGFWNVLMGFLTLGNMTVFFNDMLVSGFSTGAAVHVVNSQIKDLLGITVTTYSGPMKIMKSYREIFSKVPSSNVPTVIISAISIAVITLNNALLKPRLAKITKVPVPIELIVVVIGTSSSFIFNFFTNYGVINVGDIPTGIPPPTAPPFSLIGAVAMDSLVISVVAYAGSYSLAKIIAIKHDYDLDANQELYAMGFGNMFSSFFSCAPMAPAIARVMIQDSVGGMTQLACLITAFVILWVMLFIGPLFETLPKACLASIIVVSLRGMFLQVFDMLKIWKVSRVDAMLWVVTLLAVVIIDVDYGLLIGVMFAIGIIIMRGQHPKMVKLGHVQNTELYLDKSQYSQTAEVPGMVVVSIRGPLHFANRDNFRSSLYKVSGIDPVAMKKQKPTTAQNGELKPSKIVPLQVRYLVLDCQGMCSCDVSGAKYLTRLNTAYEDVGVVLCFAGLSEDILHTLTAMGTLAAVTEERVFHSVHDVITVLQDMDDSAVQLEVATTNL